MKNFHNPDTLKEWNTLSEHFGKIGNLHLRDLFENDPKRGSSLSLKTKDLYFDYSKNILTTETVNLLVRLAERSGIREKTEDMFAGKRINVTEDRAVLHTALRSFSDNCVIYNGEDILPQIKEVRKRMKEISEKIRDDRWNGFSGKPIKNIVNIGIGGSDLGPKFAYSALKGYSDRNLNVKFISNIDGSDFIENVRDLDPEETLFIVASKTFSTPETITNAESAKDWIREIAGGRDFISNHFLAVTSNIKNAIGFGIPDENILIMWDWVGGRYSLASSIGLSLMISIGYDNYILILKGLNRIDDHFRNSPLNENIPLLMALIGIWYNNFFGYASHAVLPYSKNLIHFPDYLQQCDMESNGKSVNLNGELITYNTGPIIWGGVGTNCQHAFFQLLHQGSRIVPVDFIGYVNTRNTPKDNHNKLMGNLFAQAKALAFGKTAEELTDDGISEKEIYFRLFPGNRPSNTLLFDKLTPYSLGMLIALYEHKIFTQGVVWNINSFDQWGVELGKNTAVDIIEGLDTGDIFSKDYDSSTISLMKYYLSSQD